MITFKDGTLELNVPVSWEQETVWLTRNQMAELFDRDVKTIGKHINNALKEELDNSTVANFATVQMEGGREVKRNIEHYNLDMIISPGYRVKSKIATKPLLDPLFIILRTTAEHIIKRGPFYSFILSKIP